MGGSSACDTGLGTLASGEGVLGLRRAFEIAGVRTVVMSLWGVQDRAARTWMDVFYRSRWLEGRDTAWAAREAARFLLAEARAKGTSTHPFYWAGFTVAGDWR